MKKKTKFKLNSSLFTLSEKITFTLFNILCIIGILVCSYLFYKNFTMALDKNNEKEIATITFKYKTAQRRFEEGSIWDRLKQESKIYNGDTIRTADLSEATLHFTDGNEMSLVDNTMTQVFLNEDNQLKALLSGGSITVDTTNASENSRGVILSLNGVDVEIENGTTLNATGTESNEVEIQVFNGEAKVTGKDGTKRNILQGNKLALTKEGTPKATVAVLNPKPNAKVINHTKNPMHIPFEWKVSGTEETFTYSIEISSDPGFKNITQTIDTGRETNALIYLPNELSYYRIICKDDNSSQRAVINGRIQLIESMIPNPIAPVVDYTFNYRKQKPVIRFLWSESKYATSYELLVSDNPNFINPIIVQRSALPSSIISTLESGKYYWRVTPFYTINNMGLDGSSTVSTFTIKQQGVLSAPSLIYPSENAFVNTKTASSNINFSWKLEHEAVKYNLIISDNQDLTNPKLSFTTDVNHFSFDPSSQALHNGKWFWSVYGIDNEGNRSECQKPRSFYAVDGEVIQRTVYPPDHYSIAQNLVNDLRFTWKSNLPFDKRFEISNNEDFTQIIYKQYIHDNTLSGINLGIGTYYWRIVSSSPDQDYPSPSKKLTVLGPLEAPVCLIPDINKRALVRPDKPFDFTWASADGANYYKLTVKKPSSDEIIFEKNLIEATQYSVNMENIPEGYYVWTIQGFSYETELQSRRTGKIDEANFELKKIHPVELVSPEDNISINGVDAILKPSSISWKTKDEVRKSQFVLTRTDLSQPEVIIRIDNPSYTQTLPSLHSGTYTWTILADSVDGFDLSPSEPRHFTITPVPPLDIPTKLVPQARTKFDGAYFKSTKEISFSWAPVKDATHYIIKIQKKDGTVIFEKKLKETKTTFSDISKLERGTFTWTVEAQHCIANGMAIQESAPAKNSFVIDLPALKATKLKEGVMYGK